VANTTLPESPAPALLREPGRSIQEQLDEIDAKLDRVLEFVDGLRAALEASPLAALLR
jgi:hypothetical protein